MGILLSYVIYKAAESNKDEKLVLDDLRFSESLFFNLILPLIVFPSGYNMRRKKFFKNIGTIMKFGFLGTIICFSLYTAMCYGALQMCWLKKYDELKGEEVCLSDYMGIFEVLSICALLCSSDVIAAIAMINYSD